MAKMVFRFTTECEVALEGGSHEEIYLKFKDLMHGDLPMSELPDLKVCPPETCEVLFEMEGQNEFNRIDRFKGDFKHDIIENLPPERLSPMH